MNTVKEEAARLVERLPDHATWEDLMYQIYVRQRLAVPPEPQEISQRGTTGPERANTFSQRWRGKFVPADRDDERYKALAKRYL